MAYAQWVYVLIHNRMKSGNLDIKRSKLSWGKFFEWSNKDHEISSAEVESKSAGANGGEVGVASCGRSDASSGTEGSFDVYDGDTHVCHIYWDCPWGSKHNKFEITNINDDYGASYDGASLDSGAIGTVTVKIGKYA